MICRFIRQLTGRSRRAKLAEDTMREHHEAAEKQQQEIRAQVSAVEELVRGLRRDTETWQQS